MTGVLGDSGVMPRHGLASTLGVRVREDSATDCAFDKRAIEYHKVVYVWTTCEIVRISIYPLKFELSFIHFYGFSFVVGPRTILHRAPRHDGDSFPLGVALGHKAYEKDLLFLSSLACLDSQRTIY
jgi:hypothetical protein